MEYINHYFKYPRNPCPLSWNSKAIPLVALPPSPSAIPPVAHHVSLAPPIPSLITYSIPPPFVAHPVSFRPPSPSLIPLIILYRSFSHPNFQTIVLLLWNGVFWYIKFSYGGSIEGLDQSMRVYASIALLFKSPCKIEEDHVYLLG